jgi:lipopolysaccharide/colanic/teichoic acid biosynthesis glycosyltransferase
VGLERRLQGKVASETAVRAEHSPASPARPTSTGWLAGYQRALMLADGGCALGGGLAALLARPGAGPSRAGYLGLMIVLPCCWWAAVWLARGYATRVIGAGAGEFQRVLRAAASLTAAAAIVSYLGKLGLPWDYLAVALPAATAADLAARYLLRKRLYRRRRQGACLHRTVVVGPAAAVAALAAGLGRESRHGLRVVGACLPGQAGRAEVAGIPVWGGLDRVAAAVAGLGADTVAVAGCRELAGPRLRELAWELEKTGTGLCLAPAVLDAAGSRASIWPVAGLPLVRLAPPGLTGARRLAKDAFDRVTALAALVALAPLLAALAAAGRVRGGRALAREARVGQGGRRFTACRFRAVPASSRRGRALAALPLLVNVVAGQMSLVGPRALTPREAARSHRRLAARPGITGPWRVAGPAVSRAEAARLDRRYVENWSLALDLQILWQTARTLARRSP